MMMGSDTLYLPEEIITEILKRLPIKSLIRFHCVSKQWENLIESSSFIVDHLHHSTHHQNASLLFKQNRQCEPPHLHLMNWEMHVLVVQNPPLISSLSDFRIISSSNGLLGVETDTSSYILWNPVTREDRQIPRTRTLKFPEWACTTGFGFSAIIDDYKIVKTYERHDATTEVEVYSLNTGSWKEIEFGSLEGVNLFNRTVTANGTIFWDGLKRVQEESQDDIYVIISFHIAMEVFSLIPGPPLSSISSSEMTVYEDRLAVLSLSRNGERRYLYSWIDLWVLEEGVGSSMEKWSCIKKYTSDPCPSTLDFPGTIWRNEIVFGSFGKHKHSRQFTDHDEEKVGLYLINMITHERKMFTIPVCHFGNIFHYKESLVRISKSAFV